MRRDALEAKREVAAPVSNRNPENRKFRVAGKFNAYWVGRDPEPRPLSYFYPGSDFFVP